MKNKGFVMENDKILAFSIRFNEEERDTLRRLKEEYGINISGSVKIFLKEKLAQLDNLKKLGQLENLNNK
jgi:hypothetical protein